jgi:hypothetical protein
MYQQDHEIAENTSAEVAEAPRQGGKLTKKEKKKATVWAIAFLVFAFFGTRLYMQYGYLLPWHAQTIECKLHVSAENQQQAFDQGEVIVRATVSSITPNQYDAGSGYIYSLVELNILEVLRGDEWINKWITDNRIETISLGGTYQNVTYVYPETIPYERDKEYIVILNSNFNPAGEPFAKLVLYGNQYRAVKGESYSLEQIKEMLSPAADSE